MEEPKKKSKKIIIGGIILIVLLLIVGIVLYMFKFNKISLSDKPAEQAVIPIPENSKEVFVNDVSGVQDAVKEFPKGVSQSENYMLKEITFGGYEVNMSGEIKNAPLEITDVKSETVVSADGKQTKLLFSWKTSKIATSTVTYAKNDGSIKNILNEQGPGLAHALVLNFEPATRYTYSIAAKDRWGNEASSDKFTTFTSTKSDNVIDLITQQFRQMFSWVVK